MIKQYVLLAGEYYYPAGGWDDHVQSAHFIEVLHETIERNKGTSDEWDWWQIVDLETGKIVQYGNQ